MACLYFQDGYGLGHRWNTQTSQKKIPEDQFQWFIDIISYLQFVTRDTVLTVASQRDEVHAYKVWKTKGQSIIIFTFKAGVPPILGGLVEGK